MRYPVQALRTTLDGQKGKSAQRGLAAMHKPTKEQSHKMKNMSKTLPAERQACSAAPKHTAFGRGSLALSGDSLRFISLLKCFQSENGPVK